MSSKESPPKGLVFFSPTTSAGARRRRGLFVALGILAAAALTWPIYPLFGGVKPLILGLPLSLAWVLLWLLLVFLGLVGLYLGDEGDEAPRGGKGGEL